MSRSKICSDSDEDLRAAYHHSIDDGVVPMGNGSAIHQPTAHVPERLMEMRLRLHPRSAGRVVDDLDDALMITAVIL